MDYVEQMNKAAHLNTNMNITNITTRQHRTVIANILQVSQDIGSRRIKRSCHWMASFSAHCNCEGGVQRRRLNKPD